MFESSFLKTYTVDDAILAKIKEDDVELMLFAFDYLASSMFGTQALKIKEELVQAKVEAIKKDQKEKAKELEEKAGKDYRELKAEFDKLKEAQGGE